jgi:hypothetical protein
MPDVYAIGSKPVAYHRMAFAECKDEKKVLKEGNGSEDPSILNSE